MWNENAVIKPQKYRASISFTSTGIYTFFLQLCNDVKIAVLQIPRNISKKTTVKVKKANQKFTLFQEAGPFSSPLLFKCGFCSVKNITWFLASILTFLYLFCRSVQSQALKDHLDWDHTTENRWTKVLGREKRY